MNKPDYLYIKEIGVDIRIRGVLSGLTVTLTNLFDTEEEAENYLKDHNWKEDPETRKWFKTEVNQNEQ
jgi:hypothetical protein